MIGREEDLLDERLELSGGQPRELREDVPELMDLAPLPPDAREDLAHGLRQTGVAVEDDEHGLAQAVTLAMNARYAKRLIVALVSFPYHYKH